MKKIEYFSTDKLYKIKKNKFKNIFAIGIISTILLTLVTSICFKQAIEINPSNSIINYNEKGNIDYKIYLKENDYYDTSYLEKGMQYVASLINTINVKFNYHIDSAQRINYNSVYRVVGELQITEKNDPSKLLYTKKEVLVDDKTINKEDSLLSVIEEIDIDYNKYNSIVNSYKSEYGLIVSSNLILTLEVDTNGKLEKTESQINKTRALRVIIPLSEQTVNIKLDIDKIDENGVVFGSNEPFKIKNKVFFVVFIILLLLTIISIVINVYLYLKNNKRDIYKIKVQRILNEYDRLIVNGRFSIDENKFNNKIYPESFEEMVDAATQLEVPIYYYEVIPNEKCFFVIVKDRTLYKYRLTKAFLEKNPNNRVESVEEEEI